uniref:Uncharacterized protein n=1 Tax=Strombidium inclinatum TaxID=197538 RepID=A0A7S3IDV9_9SPIT|mmetsp:Transcript_11817/g.18194  ORF Transcript_11817/g.18194 Transcript_11817/m.18194 type:complete len:337 (+) Transcript_11817:1295-2305(+)
MASFIGDLLTLPNTLFKPGKHFEHKYQVSTENLTFEQMFQVTGTLARIFESYYEKFRGFAMTLGQLMKMHIRVFEIIENLHNLTCIGSKDYKEALSNVQDFNATKLISEKCSIPARSGVYSDSKCEIDQIHFVSADIRLYNYIDIILRKLRLGTLHQEIRDKMVSQDIGDEYVPNKQKKDKLLEARQKKKEIESKMADNDGELSESNFQEGMMPFDIGPDGVPLKRNPSDIMNNMFIDIVSRSYTDIDQGFSSAEINKGRRGNKMEKEISDKQMIWKELLSGVFQGQVDKFGREVKDQIYTMKLHRKRQEKKNEGSDEKKEHTQSTTSDNNLDFIN